LLDDVALCLDIANEMLLEYGAPKLTYDRYREIFDFPVQLYWERAGVDFERVDFRELSERFCGIFENRLVAAPLYADTVPILELIRTAGLRQFLLSNTEHETLRRMTAHFDISDRFAAIRGMSDTLAEGKLNLARELLHHFELRRQDTVMIGDTAHDAEVARELGVDCILVARGHHSAARLGGCRVPVVDSLAKLSELLD
jgi:phosphoglycolate phosphatase